MCQTESVKRYAKTAARATYDPKVMFNPKKYVDSTIGNDLRMATGETDSNIIMEEYEKDVRQKRAAIDESYRKRSILTKKDNPNPSLLSGANNV